MFVDELFAVAAFAEIVVEPDTALFVVAISVDEQAQPPFAVAARKPVDTVVAAAAAAETAVAVEALTKPWAPR